MILGAWLIILLAAYLIGAVPFGFLAGKLKGIDLRQHGSKNIGASNAGRVMGRWWFAIVLILDAAKGFAPVFAAGATLHRLGALPDQQPLFFAAWLAVALAALLGHVFPVYLGFRGGKGVATSLGVLLGLYPYYTVPGAAAVAVWLVVTAATRYVSIGSITAAAAFPVLYLAVARWQQWPLRDQWPLLVFGIAMAGLVIFRHRSNFARLLTGEENRIGRLVTVKPPAPGAK